MLVYQIPLVLIIGLFTIIFVSYHMKELGNMPTNYEIKEDMSHTKLSTCENVVYKDVQVCAEVEFSHPLIEFSPPYIRYLTQIVLNKYELHS